MILFLNKDDLFRERIQTKDLRNDEKKWFTDYEGGCDEEAAYKYIENKFLSKCRNKDKQVRLSRTSYSTLFFIYFFYMICSNCFLDAFFVQSCFTTQLFFDMLNYFWTCVAHFF